MEPLQHCIGRIVPVSADSFIFCKPPRRGFPPQTLLYLVIIFILILKQFGATIKLSRMDRQITEPTQTLALKEARRQTDDPQNG